AAGPAHFDGVGDARLDATLGFPVVAHAEDATDDRRAEGLRDPNAQRQMFLGRAPLVFEELRSRADAPGAGVDLNAEVVRLRLYLLQRLFFQAFVSIEIGDENGIE